MSILKELVRFAHNPEGNSGTTRISPMLSSCGILNNQPKLAMKPAFIFTRVDRSKSHVATTPPVHIESVDMF